MCYISNFPVSPKESTWYPFLGRPKEGRMHFITNTLFLYCCDVAHSKYNISCNRLVITRNIISGDNNVFYIKKSTPFGDIQYCFPVSSDSLA